MFLKFLRTACCFDRLEIIIQSFIFELVQNFSIYVSITNYSLILKSLPSEILRSNRYCAKIFLFLLAFKCCYAQTHRECP